MMVTFLILLLSSSFALAQGDSSAKKNGCLSDSELLAQIVGSAGSLGEQPVPNSVASQDEESSQVLDIAIGLDVHHFNIVPHTSSLEIDGIVTREWKHPSLYFSHLKPCHSSLSLTRHKHSLWTPQLSFINAADITLHSHSVRIRLNEDGTITHSERVKQTIPCKTQASTYPFGNTTCTLIWRNDDLTRDTAKIRWKSTKTERSEAGDLVLLETNASSNETLAQSGVIDQLSLVFTFSRGSNKLFFLFFLPSTLFMFISWISLLLGPMAITRAIMCATSLILLSIDYSSNMADLPNTNGITSIDLWKIFSFIFVTFILLELVLVTLMASVGRSRRCHRRNRKGKYEMEPLYEEMNDLRERKSRRTCGCCRISAMVVDIFTLISTGFLFAAFTAAFYFEKDTIVNFLNDFDTKAFFKKIIP